MLDAYEDLCQISRVKQSLFMRTTLKSFWPHLVVYLKRQFLQCMPIELLFPWANFKVILAIAWKETV